METVEQLPNHEDSAAVLLPCHVCGRTFVSESLKKHQKVCEKNAVRKRKPFNSLKQRVEGTDIAQFHQKIYLKKSEPVQELVKKLKKSSWKEKHLELLNSIRAAKGIPSEKPSPAMRSTSSFVADTERCPSCDRQFGPKAYDRHVEWCKEKKANQRILNSPANVLLAKERLEARTKYVPPLNKFKKTPVREKYSNQSPSPGKTESTTSLVSQPSIRRKARVDSNLAKSREKVAIEGKPNASRKKMDRHIEDDSARSCDRMNCSLPAVASSPKPESVKSDRQSMDDPFQIAQQQLMDLLESNDFKSLNTPQPPIQNIITSETTPSTSKKQHTQKDAIEQQLTALNNSLDSLTDDFELMESLIDENFRHANDSLNNQKQITDDEVLDIDPYLINENDNLSLPENFRIDEDSPVSSIPSHFLIDNKVGTTIQQKSNIDRRVFSGNVLKKTPSKSGKKTSTAPPSANKISVISRKNSRNIDDQKLTKPKLTKKSIFSYSTEKIVQYEKKDNLSSRTKYLKSDFSTSLKNTKNTKNATIEDQEKSKGDWFNISELQSSEISLKPEDLFAVDDAMYEEFKKYEEMYLKGRKEKNSSKKHKPKLIEINYKILTSGEANQASHLNSKISTDSAYGSLTRSTPENRTIISNTIPLEETIMDSCELDEPDKFSSPKHQDQQRLPKFCHECGNKYPVATAKFCVECGVRRLIL